MYVSGESPLGHMGVQVPRDTNLGTWGPCRRPGSERYRSAQWGPYGLDAIPRLRVCFEATKFVLPAQWRQPIPYRCQELDVSGCPGVAGEESSQKHEARHHSHAELVGVAGTRFACEPGAQIGGTGQPPGYWCSRELFRRV
jgi:hypothetical protein